MSEDQDYAEDLHAWYAEDNPDAAQLLDDVEAFVRRFSVLPGEHCYVGVALWAAHTHFIDRLETTPRLACLSPEPGSGKTRVLEVLDVLCANPLMALDISMSAFFRIVEDRQPTILLDEVDAIFIGKKQSEGAEDMRRVINNGYRVGAVVQRVGGKNRDEVQDFHVFTPVAMAGLGNLPDTLMSRAVVIRMKRRRTGEIVQQFRDRLHRPEGEKLQARMTGWAASVPGDLDYPALPDGVEDRDADVWEPLLMVADIAGGSWPKRARKACLKFIADKPESAVSLGVRLLADLKRIWPENAATMSTSDILGKLADLDEAPWGDLYGEGLKPRKLAQLLSDYDIKSQDVWTTSGSRKGYRREDMWDSWQRYIPPEKRDVGDVGDEDLADLADLADSEETSGPALFDPSSTTNGEARHCGCGNALTAPEALATGKCRPCRDKAMAGYER
ncbi:hypothetical protein NJB1907f44_48970 [Mycobacterium marinum]|uniref:DUF3631 domain-containing protein n=1 Tax=Mycobacterium marinum TaxID=1781 RepID=UPI0021C4A908|nr:DUF3631 domain-containing protein [Mycobacterium marinum]GJN99120.1 hypothetical protein NJB1907E8_50320 [Mycobacterium marinum]GJO06044.1 hypothetical protein NJB1907E90_16760 [Mycobacterium marinum]GJO10651.1 hypothetical protein NJB1808e29_46600 [Mycobacterium marinum]GJO14486.1 hypothetical protein NJB1907f34b_50980 [Mycobacterium marinum]GJO29435.1 hypothetical protein NJB1907E11_48990 [Mycobacterium marinum]